MVVHVSVSVSGLYLPLTSLTVAIPKDVDPPVSLLHFKALDTDGIVKFKLLGAVDWLLLDADSGELSIVTKVPSTGAESSIHLQ